MEYHQTIVLKHWDRLTRLCESLCIKRNKLYLADDMFCEAIVDKSERAYQSFDASRNDNVEEYMLSCFRYYARDWLAKHIKKQSNQYSIRDDESYYMESSALSARDEVIAILGCLPSLERRLLTLRFGYGWTYNDIATALKQPESSVRVACNEALLKAQWYAKQRKKRNIV